jgi:hypothetical protein
MGAVSVARSTMLGMSRHGRADSLRGRPDCWSATGWLLAVTAICGVADFLALPDGAVWFGMPLSGDEMFRPEWLVMATVLAYPLVRLAQASYILGVLGFLLSAGEMLTIVDNGRERYLHNAELFGGGPGFPTVWYAVAVLQGVVFLVATSHGLRRRWAARRWERMMRKLTKGTVSTGLAGRAGDVSRPEQVAD